MMAQRPVARAGDQAPGDPRSPRSSGAPAGRELPVSPAHHAGAAEQGLTGMVMKLFSTQLGYDLSKTALDVLGDRALPRRPQYARHGDVHYSYMWSLVDRRGTANVQRNIIAERGLGLPRDNRPAGRALCVIGLGGWRLGGHVPRPLWKPNRVTA
jgi:hypothetical protein